MTNNYRLRGSLWNQPLLSLVQNHLISYPTPSNLTGNWNWGVLAGLCLVLQILTGIFLAMHYTAHVDLAFNSVQHLMRDVPYGWLLRYLHANGASLFFIVVYMHLFRGLYYTSYAQPREAVWLIGVVILLVMILTAFIGYVLPWGQMSLWGESLPQMDITFLCQIFFDKISVRELGFDSVCVSFFSCAKIKSYQRIGPHNIDVLSVIFGCLLGDAYAEYRCGSTRICFQQESSNASYLYGLHSFFAKRGYCSPQKPKLQTRVGNRGKIRYVLRFKTWSFKSFNWIYEAFYQNHEKIVPSSFFLNLYLNGRALSHWIMDDGTKSGSGLTIATNSFNYKHLLQLQTFLKEKYDIVVSINKCGADNQYVLYFHAKTIPKLANLVSPFIVENMKYKLGKYGSST